MNEPTRTAKVKLVTIIVPYERTESLARDLAKIGVKSFTSTKADGRGHHGPRHGGLLDSANLRLEVLVSPEVASSVLALIEKDYGDEAVIAFTLDVEAVPYAQFV